MKFPNDYNQIIYNLKKGIKNKDLYEMYGFNMYVGIKVRKNIDLDYVDLILLTWNREKSLYDNYVDINNKILMYVGAGLDGKQKIARQNSTLIKCFNDKWDIPIIFCSKIGNQIQYVSKLSQSSLSYLKPDKDTNCFRFYFEMKEINYKSLNTLLNVVPHKKVPWIDTSKNILYRKKQSIKRVISDQRLRDILKELQFIGDIGELLVLAYESSRLVSIGLSEYVDFIEHTSMKKGHGYGYDIKSYDYNLDKTKVEEIFIEVKTTRLGSERAFEMSENEYETLLEKKNNYRIYRVFEIYDKADNIIEFKYPFVELIFSKKTKDSYNVKYI